MREYNPLKVIAALKEANGIFFDDCTGKKDSAARVAILDTARATAGRVTHCVLLLEGVVYGLSVLYIEDGVVHLGEESVGFIHAHIGALDAAIDRFNNSNVGMHLHSSELLAIKSNKNMVVGLINEPLKEVHVEDLYVYDRSEFHDEAGTIFQRNVFDGVSWNLVRDLKLEAHEVFVRLYDITGEISHYVRLPMMEALIKHVDFCEKNHIHCDSIRNKVYIKQAISEFYKLRK